MKNLLKIALLLCAVSGQAWGMAPGFDGGEAGEDSSGSTTSVQVERTARRIHSKGRRRGHGYSTAHTIFGNFNRPTTVTMPLLNAPIDPRYVTANSIDSHYADKAYIQEMQNCLNTAQVTYKVTPTGESALLKEIFLNFKPLEALIIAQANVANVALRQELHAAQQENVELKKRWSAKTTAALTALVGVSGYLAYQNRDSLSASCKNWFNKRFTPVTTK